MKELQLGQAIENRIQAVLFFAGKYLNIASADAPMGLFPYSDVFCFDCMPSWDELLEECQLQGVLLPFSALMVVMLKAGKFGEDPLLINKRLQALQLMTQQGCVRQTQKDVQSLDMIQKLLLSGVESIVMKGFPLNDLYPEGQMRLMDDLDLLVKRKHKFQNFKLMKNNGYSLWWLGSLHGYHHHYIRYGANKKRLHQIEVHYKLAHDEIFMGKDFDKWESHVWSHAMERSYLGLPYTAMCHEDAFLFLFSHFCSHMLIKGVNIRNVLEFAMFLNKYEAEMDWAYVLSVVDTCLQKDFFLMLLAALKHIKWIHPSDDTLLAYCKGAKFPEELLNSCLMDMFAFPHFVYRKDAEYGWDSFGWRYPLALRHWWLRAGVMPIESLVRVVRYGISPMSALRWTALSMKSVGLRRRALVRFGLI